MKRVVTSYDVAVVGGGSAGLAAAFTAAKAGARTVIVERHGSLGGMATASLVHSICGLYFLREEPEAVLAHSGFPSLMCRQLVSMGVSPGPVRMGRLDVLPVSPPGVAFVSDLLVAGCPGLEVLLHTELVSAEVSGSHIVGIKCVSRGNLTAVRAASWIDASGDASLCAAAGAAFEQAPAARLQRPAFIFGMQAASVDALDADGRVRLAHQIAHAVSEGRLSPGCLGAQFRSTGRGGEVYVTIDLAGRDNFDPTDPRQISELERGGRGLAFELQNFLREQHHAFRNAHISVFPARLGVRESRRIRGRASVSGEAVLKGSACDGEVAIGTWPMEIREAHTGPRWRYSEDGRPTRIPLGALRAESLSNLWGAGRCISCEHEAQAALRVMGTCMATGQAAGAAAALQASHEGDPCAESVRQLIETELNV